MTQTEDGDDYSFEKISDFSAQQDTSRGEACWLSTFCPIVIWVFGNRTRMDNIITALEHNDRICKIDLSDVTGAISGTDRFGDVVDES